MMNNAVLALSSLEVANAIQRADQTAVAPSGNVQGVQASSSPPPKPADPEEGYTYEERAERDATLCTLGEIHRLVYITTDKDADKDGKKDLIWGGIMAASEEDDGNVVIAFPEVLLKGTGTPLYNKATGNTDDDAFHPLHEAQHNLAFAEGVSEDLRNQMTSAETYAEMTSFVQPAFDIFDSQKGGFLGLGKVKNPLAKTGEYQHWVEDPERSELFGDAARFTDLAQAMIEATNNDPAITVTLGKKVFPEMGTDGKPRKDADGNPVLEFVKEDEELVLDDNEQPIVKREIGYKMMSHKLTDQKKQFIYKEMKRVESGYEGVTFLEISKQQLEDWKDWHTRPVGNGIGDGIARLFGFDNHADCVGCQALC